MDQKRREPVRLASPKPIAGPWVYTLLGALVGALFENLICDPLDIVFQQVFNFLVRGYPMRFDETFRLFNLGQWPGVTLTGILYGSILGYLFYRVRESRYRIDALHHEFELQVATLRHHYKNLAVGIHGFSSRVKRKFADLHEKLSGQATVANRFQSELEGLQRDADILEEASQKLTHTLGEELLFLKALTSNTITTASQNLFPVLVHAIRDLKGLRFQEKELRVEINGQSLDEAQGSLIFPFEPYTMQIILQNVLSNAMKFGDHIQVEVSESKDWARVGGRDNGPGLEVEKIKSLLLGPAERRGESTHLGLKVSLHLLEKYGGHLSVWSEPGTGAEFVMEFPKNPLVGH